MAMEWSKLLSTERLKPKGSESSRSSQVGGDRRSQFDRDFDRSIYSTPFRRLQDKTQVFPLEPNDSVRTRLTHSLEVSSVARGLAKDVCIVLQEKSRLSSQQASSIETIAATCGLIHDLGNPPFGHSGEVAIREWFELPSQERILERMGEEYAVDFRSFEGNAQTLRLLTRLQVLADFYGLNLTCGTLSAACKYTASASTLKRPADYHERSKLGVFASELPTIEQVRRKTGTGESRNPITFLVEAADDAVYNTVDIEDGFKKRLLDWGMVKTALRRSAEGDPVLEDCISWAEQHVDNAQAPLVGRSRDGASIKYFRVRAIAKIVAAVADAFLQHYDEIMQGEFHGELVQSSDAARLVNACRKLNGERVYCSEETLRLELMGRNVIWDLMDLFWEGVSKGSPGSKAFADKALSLMSANYRQAYDQSCKDGALPVCYCKAQLLTDYICGMTDTFAADLHRRLTHG